jgi:hypothetical protein
VSYRIVFSIYTAPSGPPIDVSVEAVSPESLMVKWKVRTSSDTVYYAYKLVSALQNVTEDSACM